MAKIDKYYLLDGSRKFDYTDKENNINNHIAYMLNRTVTMFDYDNLPDTIPQKELELMLNTQGQATFFELDGNYYVTNAGLGGATDEYNRPTKAVISIPYLSYNATLEINKDCIVINNDSLGIGLLPMLNKYCFLLNENYITMILATVNLRNTVLLSANDDSTVASAELFIKNVFDGKMSVIAENRVFDSLKVNNTQAGQAKPLTELIEFEQYIKASLYNELGLSANYNMKRERLTKEEFTTNSDALFPLVDDMLNNRVKALEKINDMYGLDITVKFNSSWDIRNRENVLYIDGLQEEMAEESEAVDPVETVEGEEAEPVEAEASEDSEEPEDPEEPEEPEDSEEPEEAEDEPEETEETEEPEEDEDEKKKKE